MSYFRTALAGLVICVVSPVAWPQGEPRPGRPAVDGAKMVELTGFEVTGTGLPKDSILRLSGLKIGQQVNYPILSEACRKITSTGLVKAVDYAYNLTPGQAGVVVSFQVFDEEPALPAKIVPAEDASILWSCLASADPIFKQSLPNTKNAMSFYAANINRCLSNMRRPDAEAIASVACDPKGKPAEIVFDIRPKGRATAAR